MNFWQTIKNIHKHTELSWWQFWLLCLFFCALSFGQLGRLELGKASFYIHDFIVSLWLLTNFDVCKKAVVHIVTKTNWKKWWSGLAFGLWVLLGMILAWMVNHDLAPWLYLIRLSVYLFFLYTVFLVLRRTPLVLRILMISSGIYMVWFGLLQYFLVPDARYLQAFGWDEHYFRLIGPLLDPNLSGMLYLIVGWLIFSLRKRLPNFIWAPSLILTVLAIVLTYSRATYLALAFSVGVFFLFSVKSGAPWKKWLMGLALVVCCAVLVYMAAPKPGGDGVNLLRTTSITARIDTTQLYVQSLRSHEWLTGTGFYTTLPGSFPLSHARVPDNVFVLIIVNTGIIGLIFLFTFFTKLFPSMKSWNKETLAALSALFIHAQFNNSALEPFVFLTVGMMLISQLHGHRENFKD